jgi:hypothetical protein
VRLGWFAGGEALMTFLSTRRRVLEYAAFGFSAAAFKVYAPPSAAAQKAPNRPPADYFFATRIARP